MRSAAVELPGGALGHVSLLLPSLRAKPGASEERGGVCRPSSGLSGCWAATKGALSFDLSD